LGDEAVELAASAGLGLYPWQQDALRDIMSVDGQGQWLHFECGLNVARQNGKGAVLEARELAMLFLTDEKLGVHSAHEFATSEEHMRRVEELIQNTPELHARVKAKGGYKHAHGTESINLVDGSRLVFRTRTKSGLRGYAGVDLLALDEAMIINQSSHGAMMPTLRASSNPQLIYAGSAVDQQIHEHGLVWARIRERGHRGDDPDLCYLEFSAPADHPLEVSDAMARDELVWAQANPSLGIRISVEHMRREFAAMDPRTFAVELLGAGDWPQTDGMGDSPLSFQEWESLEDVRAVMQDPVCLAFDVSPDRSASIVAVGDDGSGRTLCELTDHREGTAWVPGRLADLVGSHDVIEVVCDGYGPVASLASKVEGEGVTVRLLNSGEHGQACGRVVDAIHEGTLRHLGQDELTNAVRGARARPLGDAWAWSRKNSQVDISPLVALTLAHFSASELIFETGDLIY